MNLDIPADLTQSLQSFVAAGGFADETAVLREALAALHRQQDLEAIRSGLADEAAGRLVDAQEHVQRALSRLAGNSA